MINSGALSVDYFGPTFGAFHAPPVALTLVTISRQFAHVMHGHRMLHALVGLGSGGSG